MVFDLPCVFPNAESLIQDMRLEVHYKDVTFETLNGADFLESAKAAFPNHDWDRAYAEFKAAGQTEGKEIGLADISSLATPENIGVRQRARATRARVGLRTA